MFSSNMAQKFAKNSFIMDLQCHILIRSVNFTHHENPFASIGHYPESGSEASHAESSANILLDPPKTSPAMFALHTLNTGSGYGKARLSQQKAEF